MRNLKPVFRLDSSAIRSARLIFTAFRATAVPGGEDQLPGAGAVQRDRTQSNTVYGETLTGAEIVLPSNKAYSASARY